MRVGIIGAGRMGQALATRCAIAGHQVTISNSRGPHTLAGVVAALEGNVRAGTVAQAVQLGEVVAIAIPLPAVLDLPAAPFTGRIVVDATNYYPEPDRRLQELDADLTTSSELLASTLPGAAVVKAFNTIYFRRLLDDSQPNLPATQRLAIPVAGDDVDAKRTVIDLIDQLGFTAVDTGTLAESRRQQPGSSLYQAFAKARAAGETLTASRARQLLAAAPEGHAVPDLPQGGS